MYPAICVFVARLYSTCIFPSSVFQLIFRKVVIYLIIVVIITFVVLLLLKIRT